MKITEKAGVLSIMGILLIFIIVITSSYAYFRPTIQGNDTAKTITLSSKKIPPHPLYAVMEELATQGTYASTYSGNDTNDSYGTPGTKTIYYIKTSTANNATQANELINNKINVKFAGFCWQILRTTDTGGIKLIYNGEPDGSGNCLRQDVGTDYNHKGIIGTNGTSGSMIGNYMYSDTFTYNTTTGEFTLVNPVVKNWSNSSDKEYILGKYTCKNGNTPSTCPTLYYVNTPHRTTANNAWYTSYTIGDTQHAQIGTSPFNANYLSPAYAGYKYGDNAYEYVSRTAPNTGSIMGKDVYWNGSNYVLKDGENNSTHTYSGTPETNYHYTCGTESATCTGGKVRYYYYSTVATNGYYYYIELTNGDKVEDAITKMFENRTNINNSTIKSYLENWYYNNIYGTTAEDYIDQDAVYCNDRTYTSIGGWSKTADTESNYIAFNHRQALAILSCAANIDKFSVSNASAEINYPIGLATAPEMNLINNTNIRKTGQYYWSQSPNYFAAAGMYVSNVRNDTGAIVTAGILNSYGVRPVITLKPSRETITGNGSLSNPYVIGENN